jgi:hypothetical protein
MVGAKSSFMYKVDPSHNNYVLSPYPLSLDEPPASSFAAGEGGTRNAKREPAFPRVFRNF